MKVLIISSGEDSGGVGIAIKQAFDRHAPDYEVRQVRFHNNYLDYPADISLERDVVDVNDLFVKADVVHFMERWYGQRLPSFFNKPKVMHHHGTIFRQNPTPLMEQADSYRAVSIVSTIDLLLCAPPGQLRWVGNPVDTVRMQQIRAATYRPTRRPLVIHAPTGREKKGTAEWLSALEGLDADLHLIEGASWPECLLRKAAGDLLMDQLRVGYGNNALEAWGMGIPVISGVGDQNIADRMQQLIGFLPFYRCTPSTVDERLTEIVTDADLRREYASVGQTYVNHFHDERKIVERWKGIYEEALG